MLNYFHQDLLSERAIKANYVPYYVKWVGDCYSLLNFSDTTPLNADQKNHFFYHIWQRVTKQASVHTLMQSFATHLLENGFDISMIQLLLGHADLQTTMIYTHVAAKNIMSVRSPVDKM